MNREKTVTIKKSAIVLGFFLFSLGIYFPFYSRKPVPKVAIVGYFSGPLSAQGQSVQRGCQLALKRTENQIKIDYLDAGSLDDEKIAEKLADSKAMGALIFLDSKRAKSLVSLLTKIDIPTLFAGNIEKSFCEINENIFVHSTHPFYRFQSLIDMIMANGIREISIFAKGFQSEQISSLFSRLWRDAGGDIVENWGKPENEGDTDRENGDFGHDGNVGKNLKGDKKRALFLYCDEEKYFPKRDDRIIVTLSGFGHEERPSIVLSPYQPEKARDFLALCEENGKEASPDVALSFDSLMMLDRAAMLCGATKEGVKMGLYSGGKFSLITGDLYFDSAGFGNKEYPVLVAVDS